MIVREFYKIREDGAKLYRTYSDSNLFIQKLNTEEIYSEAIDVEESEYTYVETNKLQED